MILKRKSGMIKTVILSLTAAVFLPLGVHAQTDFTAPSVSSEQIEYVTENGENEFIDSSEGLVGQSGPEISSRASSEARAKIHEALKQHADTIDISSYRLTYEESKALLKDVVYWDGSLFYVQTYGYSTRLVNGYVTQIFPAYIEHEAEIEQALKRAVRESITSDMSDLQKMLALHNWLASNCVYDYSYEKYSVYDALVTGKAVCQGYKDSYEMLLRYVGILEVGTASGENHTWNQVKVGGQWYNVDVTWDSNAIENAPFGQMYYGNFMISDSQLRKNHTVEYQEYECTSTLYDTEAWWKASGTKVVSSAVPINGAGNYRIGYDGTNMSLIYRAEATGIEKVIHVFDNSSWSYRNGNYLTYYPNAYGVLQRTGGVTFVNDAMSVYRITDDGTIFPIYTYEGTDGRKIFGIRVRNGKLELQIGHEPSVVKSEIKSISLDAYIEKDPQLKKVEDFVKRMYRITLEREADAGGLDYYLTRLQSGELDGSAVAQCFVGSSEFQDRKLSADDYLAALYSAFFDRTARPDEIQYWKDELAYGMSRKYVLRGFVNSNEFADLCQDAGINRGLMILAEGEEYEIDLEKLGAFVERLYEKR